MVFPVAEREAHQMHQVRRKWKVFLEKYTITWAAPWYKEENIPTQWQEQQYSNAADAAKISCLCDTSCPKRNKEDGLGENKQSFQLK